MRFLAHSEDATYNSTDGKFYYTLDRRVANPQRIRVTRASYTATTDTTTPPQVIYLRSSKLHEVIRVKHTSELRDAGHEDSSDVLAVLPESHTTGRYNSDQAQKTYPVHSHVPLQKIDFYWTNNRTLLPGLLATVDHDAVIDALSPVIWLDPETSVVAVSAPLVVGGDVASWASRGLSGLDLISSNNISIEWTVFGSTKSLKLTADWDSMTDSSGTQPQQVGDSTTVLMFKTGSGVGSQAYLIRTSLLDLFVKTSKIKFKNPSDPDSNQSDIGTTLAVTTDTSYRLTCVRTTTSPANTYSFELLTLDGANVDTLQTDSQTFTALQNYPDDYEVVVGQQMVEDYELSHYVEISSVTAATKTAIHDYMAAKWSGTTSYVAGTHASFFAELDIVTR